MAGVHRLQHVKGLLAAHLTHHDAVWTHTQAVNDQLPLAHCAFAFDVGRTCLQPDDMFLLELEFSRILDGHDALGIGDVSRQHIEQRGLARASTA